MSTLIKTTEELKNHLQIEKAMFPATYLPEIRKAQRFYLLPILGATLLNSLQDSFDDDSLTEAQQELLELCRDVIAPLAYYKLVPKLNVRVSDDGIHTTSTGDKDRALRWQVGDLRNQLLNDGYLAIDALYDYLLDSTFSTDWKATDQFKNFTQYLVSSPKDYQKFANIFGSAWVFHMTLPTIGTIISRYIKPLIGADFYTELLTAYRATPTADQLKLIEKIQAATVHLTHSVILRDPILRAELMVLHGNRTEGISKEELLQNFFGQSEESNQLGTAAMNELKIYLNANADLFATYKDSALYTDPTKEKAAEYRNSESKGTFFL